MTPELLLTLPVEPFEDEPAIPMKLGFCLNPVSRRIGTSEPCANTVFDSDNDAVEVPGGIICGKCVRHLLTPRPVIDLPDKIVKKSHHKKPDRQPGPRKVFL